MVKRETVCTFDCNDMSLIGRAVGQSHRSPVVRRTRPAPAHSTHREDFKIGVVVDNPIKPIKIDQQCCKWNPGQGLVRCYDRRFYPDDPANCSPAPENGEFCWGERDSSRCSYTVYNFSCQYIPVGGKVWLHRDALGGYWIATPIDPPANIRIRVPVEVARPEGDEDGQCVGPFTAELLEYDIDDEGRCSLVDCDEENPITIDVYSDICQTIPADSIWVAEPFQDCEGCVRYFLRPQPVCRKRIRIIDQIDPPPKAECWNINVGAVGAPLGTKQQRFAWMNFSAAPASRALLPDPDGSIDKVDRYQHLDLYQNALTGAPLPPTTTFAVVDGNASHLAGKSVFIYDFSKTLLGNVTVLTAVYDAATDDTSLTWTPPLSAAPDAGSTVRVPAARCAGPYTVQVLDYVTEEGVSQQDPDVCSVVPCEGETLEVYSDLPCVLEPDTDWEAVPYARCDEDGSCCRYFIKDVREPFIHGIAAESIAPFESRKWSSGLITVWELGTVDENNCAIEEKLEASDCSDFQQRVFNGCPFEVNVDDRVQAHLKGCNYIITSVCCPPESEG